MDLKQLKQLWRDEGFRPKKRLGQNFLIDKNVRDNILKEIPLTGKSVVVEIGAGFGVMSFTLADMCERLIAVEKDKKVCEIMTPLLESKGNVEVICDDILNVDLSSLTKGSGRVIVFGNIPYYISTPVIIRMIEQRECIDSVYIVIQEELADRIVSPPGSKIYGSISCFIQFYTKPEKLIRIKKNSFYPRPQVDSSLLKLEMLKKPSVSVKDKDLMFKIIRTAFSERRKKAINPLSGGKFPGFQREEWKRIFEECGIDPSSRAETLSLADYARLTDIIYNNK
ncbi:MAG: ribosomal RNA small subunit methyltransferase A [Candidatus Omnitrophica bacterium]|nr:ribosomal RNA small subunit methyltransferase A [Candidatus Omnitrophota bacterium]